MSILVYAAYSLNQSERLASSSGGIFSLFAKEILSDGGVVYGVAMSKDCKSAEYIRVTDETGIDRLRTSKYLQAYIGMTFRLVKQDLDKGLSVLFTGTGCQINGLIGFLGAGKGKSFVNEKYPNLYCVDVICHGVPSPALWRVYVSYMEERCGAKLVAVNFRCKDYSWMDFGVKQINDQHKEVYISKDKDPFMLMFLQNYCLRPTCYECKAKEIKLSDITLADFWGIQKVAPEMTDGKGTSLVLLRTDKGKRLFSRIENKVKTKEVSYEDGVAGNRAEYQSAMRPIQRDTFFDDFSKMSFEELKVKYGMPQPISLKRRFKYCVKKILIKCGIGAVRNKTVK